MTKRYHMPVENPASGQGQAIPASNGKLPPYKGRALPKVDDGPTGREAADTASPLVDAATGLIKSLGSFAVDDESALDVVRAIMGKLTTEQRGGELDQALFNYFKNGKARDGFIASCPPAVDALPTAKFTALTLDEVLNMPPKEWLIDNVFGAGDLGMIYGPPGSGKTFVVIDLIFAACMGKQFSRRFDVARRLNVAYCAGEGLSGLPDRFKAAAAHHDPGELPGLHVFPQVPQLYTEGGATATSVHQFVIDWQATEKPLDLLIIDTMHSASGGADENSAQHMGKVLESCKIAIKELGCAVLLVHHTGKNGSSERGSSSLRGAMDFMISIDPIGGEQPSTKAAMQCSKLKDGEAWKPQTFSLVEVNDCDSVRVWWDEPTDKKPESGKQQGDVGAIVTLLRSNPGQRYTAKAIAEAIGIGESNQIFKLIRRAKETEPGIVDALKKPDADSSNVNPRMYWFAEQGEKLAY